MQVQSTQTSFRANLVSQINLKKSNLTKFDKVSQFFGKLSKDYDGSFILSKYNGLNSDGFFEGFRVGLSAKQQPQALDFTMRSSIDFITKTLDEFLETKTVEQAAQKLFNLFRLHKLEAMHSKQADKLRQSKFYIEQEIARQARRLKFCRYRNQKEQILYKIEDCKQRYNNLDSEKEALEDYISIGMAQLAREDVDIAKCMNVKKF